MKLKSSRSHRPSSLRLSRRAVLRGAAGTVVGLPMLDCMRNDSGTALADAGLMPRHYVVFHCPTALVTSGSRDDGMVPRTTGPNYTPSYGLTPLEENGVLRDVSVVSGLFCPPLDVPGGYNIRYHEYAYMSVLSGRRSGWLRDGPDREPKGDSSDTLVANASPSDMRFRRLYFQIDPYGGTAHPVSYETQSGTVRSVHPETSPANAYRSLFQGFSPSSAPQVDSGPSLESRLQMSSLSFAREQINALSAKLGASDRRTLDQHLTRVRELERRLEQSPSTMVGGACEVPPRPPGDPADVGNGLADQETRAELFCDLITMAIQCDMTRAVVFAGAGTMWNAGMRHANWQHIGGLHGEVQHQARQSDLDNANRWFVSVYARLVQKLKAASLGGSSLLDQSAVAFVMEGGKGLSHDAQRSAEGGGDSNHSCDNMMMMLAGRAGGLSPGQHIDLAGQDRHPAVVLNSALRAVGVGQSLGEIDGTVEQLFG